MPRLVWQRPGGDEVVYELSDGPHVVGRDDDAALRVDEPLVSRQHARLEPRDGGWWVVDLGSTNYTRVNGDVVLRERELEDGDELQFARARCRFEA